MLPENVMFEILSRVSPKTMMRCKCVCKEWLDIVSDPQFVRHHLSRQSEALMIHDWTYGEFENGNAGTLKWLEIERKRGDDTLNIHSVKSLDFKERSKVGGLFGPYRISQIGSVNGWVSYWAHCNFIHILNPVLEEHMTLPSLPLPPVPVFSYRTLGYGFGVSTTTGEYKVIRIADIRPSHTTQDYTFEIQVYTVGSTENKWRRITPNIANLDFGGGQPGVYYNNHLYWLGDHGQIYAFDMTTEEMSELLFQYPLPAQGDHDRLRRRRMLAVLKGNLSFFWCCSSGGGGFEVWVMKNEDGSNNNDWYKEIAIHEKDINPLVNSQAWTPMCLIDGCLNGTNSILMLCDARDEKLVAYCLNTNKIVSRTPILWDTNFSSIMAFRPSFVRLDNFNSLRDSSPKKPIWW